MFRFWCIILSIFGYICGSEAGVGCVHAEGFLICHRNQSYVVNTTLSMYDRDGKGIFGLIDPDDLMARLHVLNPNGYFYIQGCADDQDWLPWKINLPEPYLHIHHFCTEDREGKEFRLPRINTFYPEDGIFDAGKIFLDRCPECYDEDDKDDDDDE